MMLALQRVAPTAMGMYHRQSLSMSSTSTFLGLVTQQANAHQMADPLKEIVLLDLVFAVSVSFCYVLVQHSSE